jgi:hypothetical protein
MDADYDLPIDEDDLYWGGKLGPYWELWQESGGEGGFSAAPDRGEDTYWTGDSPRFESGVHGEWDYVATDIVISDLSLEDGSWVGWSVAAGGCDLYAFPPDDGTTAYFYNKQAPVLPAPEPMSLALMALGTVMLVRQRRS